LGHRWRSASSAQDLWRSPCQAAAPPRASSRCREEGLRLRSSGSRHAERASAEESKRRGGEGKAREERTTRTATRRTERVKDRVWWWVRQLHGQFANGPDTEETGTGEGLRAVTVRGRDGRQLRPVNDARRDETSVHTQRSRVSPRQCQSITGQSRLILRAAWARKASRKIMKVLAPASAVQHQVSVRLDGSCVAVALQALRGRCT